MSHTCQTQPTPIRLLNLLQGEREREKKKGGKGERENRTQIWAKKCEIATSSVDLLFMGGLWWHTGENIFPNSEVDHPNKLQ